jgi:hypothetical protein
MIVLKSIVVWCLLIMAESLNGALRMFWLIPVLGEVRGHQLSFGMGIVLVLAIATLFIHWLHTSQISQLVSVGLLWSVLTLTFEVILGRVIFGCSWKQIMADYNILQGGLMPFGLVWLTVSPLMAAKLRGILMNHHSNSASVDRNVSACLPKGLKVPLPILGEGL